MLEKSMWCNSIPVIDCMLNSFSCSISSKVHIYCLEVIFSTAQTLDGPRYGKKFCQLCYSKSYGLVLSSVATDDICSSSARTSVIHKEKFNVLLSGGEHNDLFNFVNHLKTFTGFAEIANSKFLGEKPEVIIAISQCSFVILRYTKLFLFCRNLLEMPRKFKISIERANLQSIS